MENELHQTLIDLNKQDPFAVNILASLKDGAQSAEPKLEQVAKCYIGWERLPTEQRDVELRTIMPHVRNTFGALEKLGFGHIVLGRHGRKTRFVWKDFNSALAAREATAFLHQQTDKAQQQVDSSHVEQPPSLRSWPFPLR